jgi:hypothetical protein
LDTGEEVFGFVGCPPIGWDRFGGGFTDRALVIVGRR